MRFRIESSSGVPLTRQLIEQIRTQCASGVLRPGDRLPSVRELARELAVNQNTILRVYELLGAEGILERRHGDGTYIADRLPPGQLKTERNALRDDFRRVVRRARVMGMNDEQIHALLDRVLAESLVEKSA